MNAKVRNFLRNGYHWHELLGMVIGMLFVWMAFTWLSFADINIVWRSIITFCVGWAAGFCWETYRTEFKGKPFDYKDVHHSGFGAFLGCWIISIWLH